MHLLLPFLLYCSKPHVVGLTHPANRIPTDGWLFQDTTGRLVLLPIISQLLLFPRGGVLMIHRLSAAS